LDTARAGTLVFPAPRGALSTVFYVLELLAIVAGYFGLSQSDQFLPAINPVTTPLWPPTGIALALLLLRGYQVWPAILAGSFASALVAHHPLPAAASVAAGTVLAALAGAWLVFHYAEGRKTFTTPHGVAKFSIILVAPTTMLSAAIALGGLIFPDLPDLVVMAKTWATWWLADAAGSLTIAPVVLLWALTPFSKSSVSESLALFLVTVLVGLVAYSPLAGNLPLGEAAGSLLPYRSLLGFLVLLPLTRAALTGNRQNAATVAFIFSGFAVWGFTAGVDPFPSNDVNRSLLLLFVISVGVSVLPLLAAAATATRQNAEALLLAERDRLHRQISQKNAALVSAKRHFQILIEGVTDYAIFVLDTSGRVASWNSAAQQMIGYSTDEILGKHFGIFYRPDERRAGEPNRALELAIQRGRHEVEGWCIRKNGTPFFITGSVSVIRDDNGELAGFANVIRDATERRDAQEKLIQAREQLAMAQKMEAIGKLTGGIAHDFNNLLMIIGGNAQTFKRLLDPKLPRAIEAIQTAAKRGESLTRQLLTFSRRQHLSPTVVDLGSSVRNMRTMIESSLRGNIVYNEKIEANIPPVKVDLAELELSIVNVAVNARDAMPNGGAFTLSVENSATPEELREDNPERAFVAISFTDTGMGIPPNLLSKVFDPFFTTKEVGKGTGLGLSQVYGFAHQAGGTVRVASEVGQGTTFTIYLPTCAEKEVTSKDTSPVYEPEQQRPTVLVVDDSAEVAEVTSSLFEHLGYATVYRDSAEAALKLLAEGTKFDLVFSDIVMPGTIDGVGLANEIRARYPKLPVILTTGYSDSTRALPPGLPILRKPFDTAALKGFIREAMDVSATVQ
jgi:PAS domain S-box-containing protein